MTLTSSDQPGAAQALILFPALCVSTQEFSNLVDIGAKEQFVGDFTARLRLVAPFNFEGPLPTVHSKGGQRP
jgi:hypothetical protein